MFSGDSWASLHKVSSVSCAMFFQENEGKSNSIFPVENVVWNLLDSIVQSFYLCNVVQTELTQH